MSKIAFFLSFFLSLIATPALPETQPASASPSGKELQFVVYLTRHGVRSPTGLPEQYNTFSSAPWPEWTVAPGYLTTHGYRLMQLFGAYDRQLFASEGLFAATGCADASHVTIYADADQRTRETGKALAAGLFPACGVTVQGLPEGTHDPLFHPSHMLSLGADGAAALAAIAGRVGGDPNSLTASYRVQLEGLDHMLANCGKPGPTAANRISLLKIPAVLEMRQGDHAAELRGPLNTASTLTENLLLEYTEGMDASQVGWGCVDGARLRSLLDLHTAASDFNQRTPAVAKVQASNLLSRIEKAMQQSVQGTVIIGAISRPDDRALFLVGHDTNLSNVAGLLNLTWLADGRRDDTPPGSSLVFELWRSQAGADYAVRLFYMTQTLEQMRSETPLSSSAPPVRVPVYIPGCSRSDNSCAWGDFKQMLLETIDNKYVITDTAPVPR